MRPTMARLTLARKIAAITLTIWKKRVSFDAKKQFASASRPESVSGRRPFHPRRFWWSVGSRTLGSR